MRNALLAAGAVVLMACAAPQTTGTTTQVETPPLVMTWADLTGRPLPEPGSTHAYGDDPAQVADLWLPDGPGPHPTVLMIHGGCWQKAIADRTLMNYAAEELRQRGLAVWNIEYRGVDEAGGGWPGTFQDVSAATDALLAQGPDLGLDVSEIALTGHSAGGHLAAWLAVRDRVPEGSPLAGGSELPLAVTLVSGGLADLEASEPVTLPSCLADIRDALTGPASDARPDVFADTSPARLLPEDRPIVSVYGARDRIAPPELGRALTDRAGPSARYVEIAGAGHVELVAPGTPAFEAQAEILLNALGQSPLSEAGDTP